MKENFALEHEQQTWWTVPIMLQFNLISAIYLNTQLVQNT